MTLPIASRNPLIEVSAALYAKDPVLVQERIDEAPMEARNKIYERMWEVMGSPVGDDKFGEKAFRNPLVPAQKKIEAVEKVIDKDVLPMPDRVNPFQPKNSLEAEQIFWDTGFDPRFDEGGNFLLAPEGSSKKTMRQVIVEVVAYCLFVFKAYFSPWSEERYLRKAILAGASFEKVWSSYYDCALVKNLGDPALVNNLDDPCLNWISLAEYDFLEKTSDIYRSLNHSPLDPPRLFPREVIFPIHRMNKPQVESRTVEKMQPDLENEDLVRTGCSFTRLSKRAYTLAPPHKEEFSFDLFEYDYVPHYLFIHATRKSAENLKLACRELRLQIDQPLTDFKCAFSFAACQTKLRPSFDRFNQAWQEYVQSHELLTENQRVWSTVDYRAEEYAALRAETKMPPKKMDEHRRIKDRPSALAYNTSEVAMRQAYVQRYPETKTGRILKALHDKLPTLREV